MTIREEITNSILHGVGALLTITGYIFLLLSAKSASQIITSTIFSLSLLLLYLMSTLHHSLTGPKAKHVFLILDYAAIYLVIASTYTPFMVHVTKLTTAPAVALFILVWVLAITGITLSAIFSKKIKTIAPIFYIALGWLSVFILPTIYQKSGLAVTGLLINGGILYTIGSQFYLNNIKKYHHTIWHVFVLLASCIHFFAIYFLNQ